LNDGETYGVFLAVLHAPKRNTSTPVSWITLIIAYLGLLAIVGILASIVIGRFGSSVLRLEKAARRIASGDLDTPVNNIQGQEELKTLGETLDEMRINLKEERERRVRFIAAVSHDLKTPLTTISGYLEAFEDGMASDETTVSRYLALMKNKADLLDWRINALLDYARVSTGEWQKKLEYRSLREYLENIGRTYAQDIRMLSMEWETDVAELGEEMVAFDASQLDRVFENLTSNAIRYCQPGCRIVLRGLRKNDGLDIVFSDNGPGMKDEDAKRVFEPYYRGEASRQGEGSGLGLFIAHTIVSSHGWTMRVDSFTGKGTMFTIHIPWSDQ
jgi:signal transduction histidine kinase